MQVFFIKKEKIPPNVSRETLKTNKKNKIFLFFSNYLLFHIKKQRMFHVKHSLFNENFNNMF